MMKNKVKCIKEILYKDFRDDVCKIGNKDDNIKNNKKRDDRDSEDDNENDKK